MACLTLGHTEAGDCSGNVLDFEACKKVSLRSMDIYGCGVYGIGTYQGCGELSVSNSTIRDCAYGPFEINDGSGIFEFTACTLAGSGWGGIYDADETSVLRFAGCYFGQQESNCWYFDESAIFEDCEFMEPTEYPDYYFEPPVFDPENMTEMPMDEEKLVDSLWYGYATVDSESGETEYLAGNGVEGASYVYGELWMASNRTGTFDYGSESYDFTWYALDEFSACLACDGFNMYVTLFAGDPAEGSGYAYATWLLLQYEDELIWFY